jgi:hypothetical protein
MLLAFVVMMLFLQHAKYGLRWDEYVPLLKGRTKSSIERRWYRVDAMQRQNDDDDDIDGDEGDDNDDNNADALADGVGGGSKTDGTLVADGVSDTDGASQLHVYTDLEREVMTYLASKGSAAGPGVKWTAVEDVLLQSLTARSASDASIRHALPGRSSKAISLRSALKRVNKGKYT